MVDWVGCIIKSYRLSRSTISFAVKLVKKIVGRKTWIGWSLMLPKAEAPKQRYFTVPQMLSIVDLAEGMWKVFFATLAGTGMRIGECCGLDVCDLDLDDCIIYVRRTYSLVSNSMRPTKTPKGVRDIDIDEDLAQMLKDYLGGRSSGLVFQSSRGTPLRSNNVLKVLNPILQQLGIPLGGKINHAFRHGRVTVLRKNGVPGDLQKQWIGHSSLEMTDRYSHTNEDLEFRRKYARQLGLKKVQ